MSDWFENKGQCPPIAKGKRVAVKLRNGLVCGEQPVSPVTPAGWPADESAGRGPCRWTLVGHPFDIIFYRVIR